MPRQKQFNLTSPQTDDDGISASQTPAAGGTQSLTIAGALASGGAVTLTYPSLIEITSGGNDAGRTFVVTGTDYRGLAQSESVTGANVGLATTTKYFKTVTGITIDGNSAGTVKVGVTGKCTTPVYPLNNKTHDFAVAISAEISAGAVLTYSVQDTEDDVQDLNATLTFSDHDILTGLSASAKSSYRFPPRAMRAIISSYTSGSLQININQVG